MVAVAAIGNNVTTALLLLVVGVAVSQLASRVRRLKVIAITDAGYLAQVRQTAVLAQSARSAWASWRPWLLTRPRSRPRLPRLPVISSG